MRDFDVAEVIKNHQAMMPIQEHCIKGLQDSTDLLFSGKHESNADSAMLSIHAFRQAMIDCGMEGVFAIILPDGETLYTC